MADNKIRLTIADTSIFVSTSEEESYVKSLAADIDADIREILGDNTTASITNAALVCSIDYLDSYRKANRAANNLRSQIKEYLADAANAKLQFDEERKRNSELDVELQALRAHLARIASEGDSTGAVEQIKNDLAKSNSEVLHLQKQLSDMTAQNGVLNEKAAAMNDYISGLDAEIARLNSVISVHLETIKTLDKNLLDLNFQLERARQTCDEQKLKLDRLSGNPDELKLPELSAVDKAMGVIGELDEPVSISSVEQDIKAALENLTGVSEEPKRSRMKLAADEEQPGGAPAVPQGKQESKPSPKPPKPEQPFAFDIDIDDKPDEFWKGGKNTNTGELPDLGWTKDI